VARPHPVQAEIAGERPPAPKGAAPPADGPVSIEQLDVTLAESAEQVLEQDGVEVASARVGETDSAPEAGIPKVQAAPIAPSPPEPNAADDANPKPTERAPAAIADRPPSLLARVLSPLARQTSGLSPTVRQTFGWLAVYTALLSMGVWGYLLVRGGDKPMDPISDPTPFLKPGDRAPDPRPKKSSSSHETDNTEAQAAPTKRRNTYTDVQNGKAGKGPDKKKPPTDKKSSAQTSAEHH
jgi:hypothetical protein